MCSTELRLLVRDFEKQLLSAVYTMILLFQHKCSILHRREINYGNLSFMKFAQKCVIYTDFTACCSEVVIDKRIHLVLV